MAASGCVVVMRFSSTAVMVPVSPMAASPTHTRHVPATGSRSISSGPTTEDAT